MKAKPPICYLVEEHIITILYQNEIDNYSQSHYQLISGFQISENLYLNVTGHYTRGLGYFEQSKPDDDFEDYGLTNPSNRNRHYLKR